MTADHNSQTYYITTPIYYVNAEPHIGHAYTTVACDFLARFMRLDGRKVCFLTGTDEHGQKVEESAQKANVAPLAYCDKVSESFRKLAIKLQATHDDFIRTTEERHIQACQALWTQLKEAGHIYLGSYAGWYSVRDEAFYSESELTKTEDGRRLAPSGADVAWVEEPSYFFRLSAWEDRLLEHYDQNPDAIAPEGRRNEVLSFIKRGLQDLSISRTSFRWGVPVPGDPDHIMYVWLDALTNYITALGYPDQKTDAFEQFWPADMHMVGKDILRFHAIYWPAFLLAANLPAPKRVFAHGWWTNEGHKISKSIGNVIDPFELIDTYGLDQFRYFVMREVPFGNDGDYSHRAMVSRMNGDLANDLGNLCQRSLSMIAKNCGGQVPEYGAFSDSDRDLLQAADKLLSDVRVLMEKQSFHRALEAVWSVVGMANRYVDEQAPWALKKTDPARMGTVLYVLAETLRHLAILVQPICPSAAAAMLDQLAVSEENRSFAVLNTQHALKPGTPLPKPQGVFPRFVEPEHSEA